MWNSWFRVEKWARRYVPNEVQIYGPKGAGKTTFYRQLMHRGDVPKNLEHTARLERRKTVDEKNRIEFFLADAGGDSITRPEWHEMISTQPPLGVIVVLDHESVEAGKEALQSVYKSLDINRLNRPAHAITRAALVFINKYDTWADSITVHELRDKYEADVVRLQSVEVAPIVRAGSARFYSTHGERFENALGDFYRVLFDPQAVIGLYDE